jgi:hypothetical protein
MVSGISRAFREPSWSRSTMIANHDTGNSTLEHGPRTVPAVRPRCPRWVKADIPRCKAHVRFTPRSGHRTFMSTRPSQDRAAACCPGLRVTVASSECGKSSSPTRKSPSRPATILPPTDIGSVCPSSIFGSYPSGQTTSPASHPSPISGSALRLVMATRPSGRISRQRYSVHVSIEP